MEPVLLAIVTRRITLGELSEIDGRATAVALTQAALDSFDRGMLERWTSRAAMAISLGRGRMSATSLAATLLSDFCAVSEETSLTAEALHSPDSVTALSWRLGHRALRTLALEPFPLSSSRALELGIVDELVAPDPDPLHWLNLWIGRRSLAALAAAARLIRTGRSEAGERIEFSRLFSTREPQEGLRCFLAKKNLDFSSRTTVETI